MDVELYSSTALQSALQLYSSTALYTLHPLHPPSDPRYSGEWEWRFGKSPSFSHSLEHKFGWALVDVQLEVANGVVARGRVYSDCLVPSLIDALEDELAAGAVGQRLITC